MGSSHSTFSVEQYKEMIPSEEMSAFFIFCKTFFENHTFDDMFMDQNSLVNPKYLALTAWVTLTPAQKEPYVLSAKEAFREAEQEGYKYNPEDYGTPQTRNVYYGEGGGAGRFLEDVYYGVSDDEDLWRVEEIEEDNEEELQQEESDDVYDEDGEW